MNEFELRAFGLGFHHGLAVGIEQNPYEAGSFEFAYYARGYDAGVADYCATELEVEGQS